MDLSKEWKRYDVSGKNIFDLLPDEILGHGITIECKANSVLLTAGDFPKYIYIIKSGQFQGLRQNPDGDSYYYFKLYPGETIGLIEVFAKEMESVATIVSLTDSSLWRIDSAKLYVYIMSDILLLQHCIFLMSKYLYNKSNTHGQLYYRAGIDRVKSFFINYYEMNSFDSQDIVISRDYQDIANSIGVSLRTVGRSIQKLKKQHLITSFNKKLLMTKQQYLNMLREL